MWFERVNGPLGCVTTRAQASAIESQSVVRSQPQLPPQFAGFARESWGSQSEYITRNFGREPTLPLPNRKYSFEEQSKVYIGKQFWLFSRCSQPFTFKRTAAFRFPVTSVPRASSEAVKAISASNYFIGVLRTLASSLHRQRVPHGAIFSEPCTRASVSPRGTGGVLQGRCVPHVLHEGKPRRILLKGRCRGRDLILRWRSFQHRCLLRSKGPLAVSWRH